MAINKMMRAALKALSYPDLHVKKTYKLQRQWDTFMTGQISPAKQLFEDWRVPKGNGSVPVRIFFPDAKKQLAPPVLLFFHGGGWVKGDINSYTRVCATLARSLDTVVISVNYRLAPEHRFPLGLEDCYHAAKMLYCSGFPFQVNPEDVTLMGDSAGGNLAAVVSQMARDRGEFAVKQQILIYPATYYDHSEHSPFPSVQKNGTDYLLTSKRVSDYMDMYAAKPEDKLNPYFAPLMAKDLKNQPRTLILTAEFDPLRDEGEAYGMRLLESGNDVTVVRVKDTLHGYFVLPMQYEPVRFSYEVIEKFLKGGK